MEENKEPLQATAVQAQAPKPRRFDRRYLLPIGYVAAVTLSGPLAMKGMTVLAALDSSFDAPPPQELMDRLTKLYGLSLLIGLLLLILLGIANIVLSFWAGSKGETAFCVNSMLIMKYGLLVFFVGNFITLSFTMVMGGLIALIASRGMALLALPWFLVLLPIAAFCTWLVLLPGAFYGVQVVRLGVREKKVGLPAAVLHVLLQFTFLADVPDAMYLSIRKWGMGKKSAIPVAIVYLAGIGAVAWLLVLLFS